MNGDINNAIVNNDLSLPPPNFSPHFLSPFPSLCYPQVTNEEVHHLLVSSVFTRQLKDVPNLANKVECIIMMLVCVAIVRNGIGRSP